MIEVVKPSHEINNDSLVKMRFVKVNEKWVSKDDDNADVVARASEAIVDDINRLYVPPIDRGEPLSPFENMVLDRTNIMASD